MNERVSEERLEELRAANKKYFEQIRDMLDGKGERVIPTEDGEVRISWVEGFDEGDQDEKLLQIEFRGRGNSKERYHVDVTGLVAVSLLRAPIRTKLGVEFTKSVNVDSEWMRYSDDFCGQVRNIAERLSASKGGE